MKYSIVTDDAYIAEVLIGLGSYLEDRSSADIESTAQAIANFLSQIAPNGIFSDYAEQNELIEFPYIVDRWKLVAVQCASLARQIIDYVGDDKTDK